MHLRYELADADVSALLAAAEAHARDHGWNVAIAICDPGGHPLAFKRLDGAAAICAYMETEKARGAALGRRESARTEKAINEGRFALLSVPMAQAHMEGGVPILLEGHLLGGIGVSGVKSADDAAIAHAGIAALVHPEHSRAAA
jgi:glc operon protein GlcG